MRQKPPSSAEAILRSWVEPLVGERCRVAGAKGEEQMTTEPITRPSDDDLIEASLELEERARVLRGRAEETEDDDEVSEAPKYRGTADRLDRVAAWLDAVRTGKEDGRG